LFTGHAFVQVTSVVKSTEELKKRQATPDSPEALACIPSLQLSDIPKEAATIPTDVSTTAAGATLLTHDLFTNNVLYAEAALPLFCRCDPHRPRVTSKPEIYHKSPHG